MRTRDVGRSKLVPSVVKAQATTCELNMVAGQVLVWPIVTCHDELSSLVWTILGPLGQAEALVSAGHGSSIVSGDFRGHLVHVLEKPAGTVAAGQGRLSKAVTAEFGLVPES